MSRANSSVGSFYARFKGKDDLIDYLGERVWREATERWREALDGREWSELDLPTLLDSSLTLLQDAQARRADFLKAIDRARRGRGDGYASFRDHVVEGLADLLLERREELTHPEPEVGVRVGLAAAVSALERGERGFGSSPDAPPIDSQTVLLECRTMLLAYLAGSTDAHPSTDVEFFDVWG